MSRLRGELEELFTFGNADCQIIATIENIIERERDEAIVGAYRAAAEFLGDFKAPEKWAEEWVHRFFQFVQAAEEEILSMPPQSALDAVERDRRAIAEMGLEMGAGYKAEWDRWRGTVHQNHYPEPPRPTADDVLAKVKRA